jgi:hypothetical protein
MTDCGNILRKFEVYFSLICSLLLTTTVIVFALTKIADNKMEYIITITQGILVNSTNRLIHPFFEFFSSRLQ